MAKTTQETPSRNEDEFFAKQDAELMKQMRAKLDKEREAEERKAHYMKCPKDGADLKEEELGPVKVDVCPECKGIWFDGGELDMLKHAQKGGAGIMNSFMDLISRQAKK
jgi:Zn-finger nucleic acid-binding protein